LNEAEVCKMAESNQNVEENKEGTRNLVVKICK
jgi:hypothetical protein